MFGEDFPALLSLQSILHIFLRVTRHSHFLQYKHADWNIDRSSQRRLLPGRGTSKSNILNFTLRFFTETSLSAFSCVAQAKNSVRMMPVPNSKLDVFQGLI